MGSQVIRAYLADVRHNFGGVLATDCMPLSVGYMKSVMDIDFSPDDVSSRIFAYPAPLLDAIQASPPDLGTTDNGICQDVTNL